MELFHSTRSTDIQVTAKQAIRQGIADDGGLFVSDSLGERTLDVESLPGKSYQEIALEVLRLLLPDFSDEELRECIEGAYSSFKDEDVTPLKSLGMNYVLELFHGPTSAFKDVALQALPRFMAHTHVKEGEAQSQEELAEGKERVLILTATSGDTGKAALDGFADVDSTGIVVFYPAGQVSEVQRMQMITQSGQNVGVVAVHGNFDDAQSKVKAIFGDAQLAADLEENAHTRLSSANSINVGRLVPQVVYYCAAYAQLLFTQEINFGDEVDFLVPTGNFGDILAGYYAKRLGLPVGKLVVASDKNNVLYDFLTTGVYDRNREFFTTISPSMDILISSNLERMLYYFSDGDTELISRLMNDLAQTGRYEVPSGVMRKIREVFDCAWADEDQVRAAIRDCWDENGYVIDPHTACAYHALSVTEGTPTAPRVVLSTASPYKFPRAVLSALGVEAPESDFACMDALADLSGVPAPTALRSLEGQIPRFTDEIDVEDMPAYVRTMAAKFAGASGAAA
ncbi:threonine synthase [Alloscardovia macacae]|uniref:Threonine synthase n=1 Tax=Alloscardovia macacae TaxID=1160091 RepID=A0A1Y2SVH6_9BIFI|nr:threonine synthase [Alloscardovia macacae]OTA26194.1 threonine synthase [Alloscardovia macacae]OTA29955.1 threonine synthase [Alloscardovia macacae]